MNQTALPCTLMRAGTSRGPFFLKSDLPSQVDLWNEVLLAAMGSPDSRQIDGIGGGTTLTSKVAIISRSAHPDADIDYQFAQVGLEDAIVDTGPSCGNMLSGAAPFAIERGLIAPADGETCVRIRDVNTGAFVTATVQTPGRCIEYDGDTAIDGVPGTAAPIRLDFENFVGVKTGALLPTGSATDEIDGIRVTCIDAAMPMVLIAAESLGKTGHESPAELDADSALLDRIEHIRRSAAKRMGLGDVRGKVIPKVALLSRPDKGGTICSRYFTPASCHAAHAVTGAIAVAAACAVGETVANALAASIADESGRITVEHPSGRIELVLATNRRGGNIDILRAGIIRTARRIMRGELSIPAAVWQGHEPLPRRWLEAA